MATATSPPPLTLAAVDPGRLYSLSDVASVFDRSPVVVERWCRSGRIAARKVVGRWMVLGAEVQRLWGERVLADRTPARGPTAAELDRRLADLDARNERLARRKTK